MYIQWTLNDVLKRYGQIYRLKLEISRYIRKMICLFSNLSQYVVT